jgi:transcriptional adapter 3
MAPFTLRKSPTPNESQSSQTSSDFSSLAAHIEIPSNLELIRLVTLLQERKSLLERRRRRLKLDESRLLQGRFSKSEVGVSGLARVLDAIDDPIGASTSTNAPLAPPNPVKIQSGHVPSPSPRLVASSASPDPGSSTKKTKIKIERDADRERGESESTAADGIATTSLAGTGLAGDIPSTRQRSVASPSLDADWDDEVVSRPGRTYQSKRKRQRTSQTRDQEDYSHSEFDTPQPGASQRSSPHRDSPTNGRIAGVGSSTSGQPLSIKLKLNPTAHTVPMRNDTLSVSIRRPSTLRGRDDLAQAMTPIQASQAAMWELPKRTSATFIPKEPITKPMRTYPTRPDQVDVDFAKMDWRERDKERDRLEAAAMAAAANAGSGPAPGQAIIKEGTAASRARDRKQDQVAHHTFMQWADGWFRTLTEEDLAWFSSKSEELDAFQIPPLGRHYSEVWEEEEANGVLIPTTFLPNALNVGLAASAVSNTTPALVAYNGTMKDTTGSIANGVAHPSSRSSDAKHMNETPKFDPRTLGDDHLYGGSSEDARGGPFTERLLAALLPTTVAQDITAADASLNGPNGDINGSSSFSGTSMNGTTSHSSSTGRSQDMADYEERLRQELRAIDVLGDEEINWSDRADDEISSTLRKVQRLLRKQIRINELRKSTLFKIAMDRMAYQDYLGCLNSVEREIESGWMKRQTQIKKSMQAQKKKKGGSSSNGNTTNNTASNPVLNGVIASDGQGVSSPAQGASTPGATGMAHSSSSIGLNTAATDRGGGPIAPQFSEALLSAIEKRRQLKFAFEPMFAEKPLAKYTPQGDDSVYKDIDFS